MKRMLTGIKPSGSLTLGNYIGAIRPCVKLQEEYELMIFVANLHAITVKQPKLELKQNTKDIIALYLACGLDPKKTTIFMQSQVLEHAQLGYILTCQTTMSELSRMTQYKDKSQKEDVIPTGIFIYPGLMAADILLYDADYVPVGDDQKQHVELTRDIAERFNKTYGDTFIVPEPVISKQEDGARIMSLQDPTKKMSKSEGTNNKGCIFLLEDPSSAMKKIRSAITDTDSSIHYDLVNKPGISNLLTIYSALTGESIKSIELRYQGKGYGEFKGDLAVVVGDTLTQIQTAYQAIIDGSVLEETLEQGRLVAHKLASKKLRKVEKKMGLSF